MDRQDPLVSLDLSDLPALLDLLEAKVPLDPLEREGLLEIQETLDPLVQLELLGLLDLPDHKAPLDLVVQREKEAQTDLMGPPDPQDPEEIVVL